MYDLYLVSSGKYEEFSSGERNDLSQINRPEEQVREVYWRRPVRRLTAGHPQSGGHHGHGRAGAENPSGVAGRQYRV